jgi:diaminohydroxyphosphoribosylaminopyrimidine deaminase/5-amino-6-(5-phosphoribosylamino)uracil reductase
LQPLRIVLDKRLQLPASHHLPDDSTPTWIVNELEERHGITQHIRLPFDEHLLPALLQRLMNAQKNSLFVEGGAALLNSFITAGLWDEARVFSTPVMLGAGIPAPLLIQAKPVWSTSVGDDMLHLYQRAGSCYPYVAGAVL